MTRRVFVLNGPNLGRLGSREPDVYGATSYAGLVEVCETLGKELGFEVSVRETNDEGEIIRWLHEAADGRVPVVINPGALTHYSYAMRDAAAQRTAPLIEVHISNPYAREEFRHTSVIAPVATGTVAGFGIGSYRLALRALADELAAANSADGARLTPPGRSHCGGRGRYGSAPGRPTPTGVPPAPVACTRRSGTGCSTQGGLHCRRPTPRGSAPHGVGATIGHTDDAAGAPGARTGRRPAARTAAAARSRRVLAATVAGLVVRPRTTPPSRRPSQGRRARPVASVAGSRPPAGPVPHRGRPVHAEQPAGPPPPPPFTRSARGNPASPGSAPGYTGHTQRPERSAGALTSRRQRSSLSSGGRPPGAGPVAVRTRPSPADLAASSVRAAAVASAPG